MLRLAEEPRGDREAGDRQRDKPPIAAPRPSVAPSRKTLRVRRSGTVSSVPTPCSSAGGVAGLAPLRLDGDRLAAELGGRFARPRGTPKTMAIAAPIEEISSG